MTGEETIAAIAAGNLRNLFGGHWNLGDLIRFHTAHKLLLLAHSTVAYRQLGRLLAGGRSLTRHQLQDRYADGFMRALEQPVTTGRHANVLQHMAGYFTHRLDPASARELAGTIEDFRRRLVPLAVPLALVRHHVRTLDVAYLAGQIYLQPHPKELMPRNHL